MIEVLLENSRESSVVDIKEVLKMAHTLQDRQKES